MICCYVTADAKEKDLPTVTPQSSSSHAPILYDGVDKRSRRRRERVTCRAPGPGEELERFSSNFGGRSSPPANTVLPPPHGVQTGPHRPHGPASLLYFCCVDTEGYRTYDHKAYASHEG
jgi:hypothetical protein